MRPVILFAAVLALSAFGMAPLDARAQEGNFTDLDENYYDLHAQRLSYYDSFIEERAQLDQRRHGYQIPRWEAVGNYEAAWDADNRQIDYDAGIAGTAPIPLQ